MVVRGPLERGGRAFGADEMDRFQAEGRKPVVRFAMPVRESRFRDEVPERYLDALEAGRQQSSLAQARRYVSNIERDIADTPPPTTSTVPTGATTVTTSTAN